MVYSFELRRDVKFTYVIPHLTRERKILNFIKKYEGQEEHI